MGSQEPTSRGGVADELRARRAATGLTRQELAQLADCSIAVIELLENGWLPKRSAVLARINKALAEQLTA